MLRYVVKLVPANMSPKDEEHYFPVDDKTSVTDAYNKANDFAANNSARLIEFYSETRDSDDDYWRKNAVYRVLADPNR